MGFRKYLRQNGSILRQPKTKMVSGHQPISHFVN